MPPGCSDILAIRFSALGDIAMAVPVVYDACRANPARRFIFLTRKHPARLFINKPANLTVEGVDLDSYKGVAGLLRLARELQSKYCIGTVVDLHNVLRTRVLRTFFALRGARVAVIDKGRRDKRRLTRRRNKVLLQLTPTPKRYADTFARAGIEAPLSFTSIFAGSSLPPMPQLTGNPVKGSADRWVAIAPFARHQGKIYPLHLMQRVVEMLAARPGMHIFLMGFGPDETATLDAWTKGHTNITNMARENVGLDAELALMARCDAMISMDSANMHLASLVGIPAVAVWGATHPYAGFMGYGQSLANSVQLEMTCRPCSVYGNKPCMRGDYHCLAGIPPQLIIDRLDTITHEHKN